MANLQKIFSPDCKNNRLQCYDIDRKNFFDQPTAFGQGDDYRTGCLIDYPYFKNYYKLIAINLSKQKNRC